jgi:hypothetical protein
MGQTEFAIILLVGSFFLFIIGRLPIVVALGSSAMITVMYLGFQFV